MKYKKLFNLFNFYSCFFQANKIDLNEQIL